MRLKSHTDLRHYRTARGLSQEKLGRYAGVSQNTISLMELGKMRSCKPQLAREIEQALNAPPGSLFEAKDAVTLPRVTSDKSVAKQEVA